MTDERNKINPEEAELSDPVLYAALRDFRASVHTWSDSASGRPRSVLSSAPRAFAWRRAGAWVLTLALSAGIVGGAAYERRHEAAVAAQKQHEQQLERQRLEAEQQASAGRAATENEDLMANVDSAVSRQVPAALAPLALTVDEIQ